MTDTLNKQLISAERLESYLNEENAFIYTLRNAINRGELDAQQWISVDSEEKPREIIKFVLVGRAGDPGSVMEANYSDGRFMVHRFGWSQEYKNPTHFMYMPEPPEVESDASA